MKLSVFCPFALKTPIHGPKIVFLGGNFIPKMESSINEPPPQKKLTLERVPVVLGHQA